MTISRTGRRAAAVALLATLVLSVGTVSPASACACGGVGAPTGESVSVNEESAVVRHDGETEDILLSFDMFTSAQDVALILPLPAQAELDVADVDTLGQLERATAPDIVERRVLRGLQLPVIGGAAGDGAGAGQPPGVHVLEERELGPFTATQLTSTSTAPLTRWLDEHGYDVRDEVVEATRPYLREGWVIAAIKLTAGPDSPHALDGELQPIRATFPSREIVYPMRMQATAASVSTLRVYTLTEHRTDVDFGEIEPGVAFAGPLRAGDVPAGSTLAELTRETPFVTRFDTYVRPEEVTTDMTFTRSATDATYRRQEVVETDYPWYLRIFVPSWGTFAFWFVVLPPVLLMAGVLWLFLRLVRGQRRAR